MYQGTLHLQSTLLYPYGGVLILRGGKSGVHMGWGGVRGLLGSSTKSTTANAVEHFIRLPWVPSATHPQCGTFLLPHLLVYDVSSNAA